MQPPSLSNNISSTTTINLSPEHRARLYSLVQQLNDDQLRLFVNNHFQSISNINLSNQLQRFSRPQLIQQAFVFVDNYYTMDLEQSLYAILQKRFIPEYRSTSLHQQIPQVQRQQNYSSGFNQTPYYFPHQTTRFSPTQDYRPPIVTNVSAQLRPIRLNHNSASNNHTVNHSVNPVRPSQTSNYFTPTMHCQSYTAQSSTPVVMSSNESSTSSSSGASHRYQVPNLPPPPSSIVRSAMPIVPNIVNVKYKTLPFYRSIICVYESYQAFRYDSYRKQYTARHEFLLPVDICNQLALSFDYDPDLDIHKTNKCLLLRLVRFDQPPPPDGRYSDHLPPNLTIQINGQNVTNLPTPKPCTRQQTDLIRVGREIDITSYCMFNPMLPNEFMMTWMYRPENASLHTQYANAQFAVHLFLVQHLSVDDLCEQIKTKPIKFYHEDLARLVAKVQANDRELGLEVSDQILKLKCPIDQRRLRIPIRAVTCQHLQCFDLTNYITMNEKASKWICPVCNKSALYDDLQIDSYTESILNSIENENIIEIAIDGDLHWRSTTSPSSSVMNSEPRHQRQITAQIMDIILDDDHQEQRSDPQIDSKLHIPLIKTQPNEPGDVILIDDD